LRPGQGGQNSAVDADAIIATLALEPHPEGGYYRETWADEAGTAIYFLLKGGEVSAWHRVHDRAEIWHFYAGDPLELSIDRRGPGTDDTRLIELGSDLQSSRRPQAVVPANAWQRARSLGRWSLVGCTVSPPFSFDVFEVARL
jgi:predicted cupin superfamily sugar epimerase